ncbi:hypothetical protein FEF26_02580 [Nesterenkonia salmonea]|uniref:TIGR03089 family protein n=1 Tax=Nesterenkonia salmonea TaxID=1804987 RepID=A0A5R9BFS9_9MICC|nr:TIGR03089 family protein [Nesterenkonia salmonea]TLP99516.1 hypothetical protein FEF26_02580 [Nesterenkonia salmonea]
MCPLTLGSSQQKPPTEFGELLRFLDSRPQPALVYYDGSSAPRAESGRIELSGKVLVNWATKLIGLLTEEHDLSTDDVVLVDMAPHWKAAAVALAAGAVGAAVHMPREDGDQSNPDLHLVVTDRPTEWVANEELGDAELAAVSLGMLDGSYQEATGVELPAWVTDVSAEARQFPDQLLSPIPAVELPQSETVPAKSTVLIRNWGPHSFTHMVGTWAAGGVVVLFHGAEGGEMWEQMLRNEGLSGQIP